MEGPLITILIRAYQTNTIFFKDCMESLAAQTYDNWELFILDANEYQGLSQIAGEFFPQDKRVSYRRIRRTSNCSFVYNMGFHFGKGQYFFLMGQHDRLSDNTLETIVAEINKNDRIDLLYTDEDELEGMDRVHPHFKSDWNVELLMQKNYIGESFCISTDCLRRMGLLREELNEAALYEFLLRTLEYKVQVIHLPRLLYHRRIFLGEEDAGSYRQRTEREIAKRYHEELAVVSASLQRRKIEAEVKSDNRMRYVKVMYDGNDYRLHAKDYLLLRGSNVRVFNRYATARMYGILKQRDVGVVGIKFIGTGWNIDNCGYIFDDQGIAYPACYNQSMFRESYDDRMFLRRDVSMVDFDFCMIDAKLYRKVGGFNPRLKGRDVILDFCLKTRAAGRRIVFEPSIVAHKREADNSSSQESNAILMEQWKDQLQMGDPYYNSNLPVGLENYILY